MSYANSTLETVIQSLSDELQGEHCKLQLCFEICLVNVVFKQSNFS